jgi:ribonucleoside-diphosphate reductase alpha chain
MDCDTTGVEPDFALLKFKKLVGGGSMQIVNAQVPRALASLGYQNETIEAIEAHIVEHGHVENAPGLRPEHYAVFDCAVGDRAISPDGHILMMAAVQPFVSGAISKTVNLPETATVEDIERVYLDAWKLGLKAVAVYRDNCKVGQPLSSAKPAASEEATAAPTAVEREIVYVEVPTRTRLPRTRGGQTVSFEVQGNEGYLTTGVYEDGRLGEVFVKMSKQGSTLAGLIDAFSIAVSIGLQYGVPLETYIEKFIGTRFEPAGVTDDPDIRMAQSVVDYIFRRLALDYLDTETRSAFGILSASERIAALDTKYEPAKADPVKAEAVKAEAVKAVEPPGVPTDDDVPAKEPKGFRMEAPICSNCGHNRDMRPSGSCWACACGTTTGCS